MPESTPRSAGESNGPNFSRRTFLKTALGLGLVAAAGVPQEVAAEEPLLQEAVAEESLTNGEVAGLLSRFYELGHSPVEYRPLVERNAQLEYTATVIELLTSRFLDQETSEDMQQAILEKLHVTLSATLPEEAKAGLSGRSRAWQTMEMFHSLSKVYGKAGYFFNYTPMVVGYPGETEDSSAIDTIIFAPSNLRAVSAVNQRRRDNFWNQQSIAYHQVTLGPAVVDRHRQPLVAFKTHLARSQSGVDAAFDTVFVDPVWAERSSAAANLLDLQKRVRTNPDYQLTAQVSHEVMMAALRNAPPEQLAVFAAERFIVASGKQILAATQVELRRIEQGGSAAHEESHIYFERLARARREHVIRAGDALSLAGVQFAMKEREVEAEIAGSLGALIYNQESVPDDYRWFPMYLLCQSVAQKERNPGHGLADEWILRELVKRVVACPTDFGLDLAKVPKQVHELTVWAKLDTVAAAPRETLNATWQDIAAAYQATIEEPFITPQNSVISRPLEAGKAAPMHPSWSELLGSAGTLMVGTVALVIHSRMEADKQVRVGGKIVQPKNDPSKGRRQRP